MDNKISDPKRRPTARQFHIIFLTLCAVAVLVMILRAVHWNKEKNIEDEDPTIPTDELFIQSEDYITYMDPSLSKGIEDDGITSVLFLGDETIGKYRGTDGIPAYLEASLPNCRTYNAAFNGTSLMCRYPIDSPDSP